MKLTSSDMFLKLDGIDGQSTDKGHSNWIEILDLNFGSQQEVTLQRGADVAGRGIFKPIIIVHLVDKATPKFQQFCMNGQKIAKGEFCVCRAIAGVQVPVFEVKMENIKIKSATISMPEVEGDGRADPIETVELLAGKITWKVTPIKADNTKDGAIEASFDQISNS